MLTSVLKLHFDADKCSKIAFFMLTSVLKLHLNGDEFSKANCVEQ